MKQLLQCLTFVFFLFIFLCQNANANEEEVVQDTLGRLHWCDTLCLCHDDLHTKMECFSEVDIYGLMKVPERQIIRMTHSTSNFILQDRLTWCTDTCLCHKHNRKEFKCTDTSTLRRFIGHRSPELVDYLMEPEYFETRDMETTVHSTSMPSNDDGMVVEDNTHHGEKHRKRGKKHRKNRRKQHHDEEIQEDLSENAINESRPLIETTAMPEPDVELNKRPVIQQASIGRGSSDGEDTGLESSKSSPILEVPLERKTVAAEVSEDLVELQATVDRIQAEVDFNQKILLGTLAVAAITIIGLLLLTIYSCCFRRKDQKGSDTSSSAKVNLTDKDW